MHCACNRCLACENKELKKWVKYWMKEAGEACCDDINPRIKWDHWQAELERKLQHIYKRPLCN
jgi:hypothetical protein